MSGEDIKQVNSMYKCSGGKTTSPTRTTTRTTAKPTTCTNKRSDRNCSAWKRVGYCERKYQVYMSRNCAKTCGKCSSKLDNSRFTASQFTPKSHSVYCVGSNISTADRTRDSLVELSAPSATAWSRLSQMMLPFSNSRTVSNLVN